MYILQSVNQKQDLDDPNYLSLKRKTVQKNVNHLDWNGRNQLEPDAQLPALCAELVLREPVAHEPALDNCRILRSSNQILGVEKYSLVTSALALVDGNLCWWSNLVILLFTEPYLLRLSAVEDPDWSKSGSVRFLLPRRLFLYLFRRLGLARRVNAKKLQCIIVRGLADFVLLLR
ncbi:hypothetical protein F511_12295 [Dorcoceras hygrometricum]|uniref:Uncharacterized protein n=1 Tax=Dorcoceras hygrometricum TaxID=472368 RepID=A0A2Z7C3Y0_9LAMI|nr:hypothetical protein F511_12295 [Dorcoceras hygrometricum]